MIIDIKEQISIYIQRTVKVSGYWSSFQYIPSGIQDISSNQDRTEGFNQSGVPFGHKSFKLKSSFNPVGPFQLESMFYFIEQDLHRQNIESLGIKIL